MIPFINLPARIVRLFTSNVAPSEVAAGVVIGMFMGFVPANGPMFVFLIVCFFIFKINRLASMLVLPLFKIFYIAGVSYLADSLGEALLIKMGFLAGFWGFITHLPLLALLDINNTLVAGGLAVSAILAAPVYLISKKGITVLRAKYLEKMKKSKFVKLFVKMPIIGKIIALSGKIKGG